MTYLADYHVHSSCSPDGRESMTQLVQGALQRGIQELCITDHVEPIGWDGGEIPPHDWTPAVRQFEAARRAAEGTSLRLRLGAELGEVTQRPGRMDEFLSRAPQLDFTIGSVHTASAEYDWLDLCFLRNPDRAVLRDVIRGYLGEVKKLAQWGRFCVLGHLTLPLRYIQANFGICMDFSGFEEQLEEIFRIIIPKGIGIELNSNRGGQPLPGEAVLRQYKSLGGELVTLGSDAHRSADLARGIREGQALLRRCGFTAFATYTRQKPEFHDL